MTNSESREINTGTFKSDFLDELRKESGEDLSRCYQCRRCSAGCPVGYAMDYLPNQIISMIRLGMQDEVMSGTGIWLCVSCHTCSTRCPQRVDFASVMTALRIISQRRGIKAGEREPLLLNRIFVNSIKNFGRIYELGMIGLFNLLSGNPFKDLSVGLTMFRKGKINIFPSRVKNWREVRDIFKRINNLEK